MLQRPCHRPRAPGSRLTRASWLLAPLAGIAVVMSACADTAPGAGEGPGEVRLAPLPSIGGQGGPEPVDFGRVADLEIGEDGDVFVLDGMGRTVRVFDRGGQLAGGFGARGRGPDELEQPVALIWGPGGDLWVVDAGNGRYAVFGADGEFVETHPIRFDQPAMGFEAIRFLQGGGGLLVTVNLELQGGSLEHPQASLVESELVDGEVGEVGRTRLPFVEWPPVFRHEAGGSVLVLPVPFSSEPLFRLAPDGSLWYAHTREPWVHRWSPSGGVEQTVGRQFEPPPVTEADLERVREDAEELRRVAPDAFAEMMELVPDSRPHLDGFFLDDVGRVWILRAAPAGEDERTVDVYERDGTLVASLRVALEPEPTPRVRGGLLVGVVRDELDVESVVRYRIEG